MEKRLRKRRNRSLSLLLCLTLSLSLCLSMPFISFAADNVSAASGADNEAVRGTHFTSHGTPEMGVYSDSYFRGDSLGYNDGLATMSFELATSTLHTRNVTQPYFAFNLHQYLEDNGFVDFEANADFETDPDDGTSAAAACAHKKITDNGKEYTLLAIVPRSGSCGSEYKDNCVQSSSESDTADYTGYANRAEKTAEFARSYIKKYGITGDIKVWTAGYSGGAGTVQLLASDILRDPKQTLGSGVSLNPSDFYCYAFSGMRVASLSGDYKDPLFNYIHNYCEDTDLISNLHTQGAFARYGQMKTYSSAGSKDRMLELLAVDSQSDYQSYVGSGDPDGYFPLKIDTEAIKKGQINMLPDGDSYLPKTQAAYKESVLDSLAEFYARSGNGDPRTGYYKEYQQPMMAFSRAIDNDTYLFMQALSSTDTSAPLLVSMYATYMVDNNIRNRRDRISENIEDAFNALAEMIEDADGNLRQEYKRLSNYAQARDLLFKETVTDGVRRYELKYDFNRTLDNKLILKAMKRLTGRLFAMSFETAFEANGIDRSRYEDFLSTENSTAVAWIFTDFTFDNSLQSKTNERFSFENEQFKQAATLIGNLNRLLTPHYSANIIEWLRSADDNYSDYSPVDAAQAAGYRRIYIKTGAGATVSGSVKDANGNIVARFDSGKITSRTESWIGYTASDDGGWLRLPVDKDYLVDFSLSKDAKINIKVADYSVSEGEVIRTVRNDNTYNWTGLNAKAVDKYTLNIPSVEKTNSGYDLTSAYYSLSIRKGSAAVPKLKNVKVKAASKGFTVSWKKLTAAQKSNVTKIQIQYSTSKKFKQYRTVLASKGSSSKKVTGLKKGKTYYVRVRCIKYLNDGKTSSKWSAIKRVKVK